MHPFLSALFGGAALGLAGLMLLAINGRILGVSGVYRGALRLDRPEGWRWALVAGLLSGGAIGWLVMPQGFAVEVERSLSACLVAGVLVGFGTTVGSGCTSGHGICGLSRLSTRSLVATLTFMVTGAASVFVVEHLLGGRI